MKIAVVRRTLFKPRWHQRLCASRARETSHLAPFRHEEADTRMILHLADAINKGFHNILLHTVAKDEVVLSVAAAAKVDI